MDNITHSLVGIAAADALTQNRFRKLRGPAIAASLLGNNLPDLDFLYAHQLSNPFGYILHHRGHTHTLLLALPQAALIIFCLYLVARSKKWAFSRSDWWFLSAIAALGVVTHITLDAFNSYGVHPFWPINNNWFYLDAVFILEPCLWLCLGAALAFEAKSKWGRWALWGIFVGSLGLVSTVSMVPMLMKGVYWAAGIGFATLFGKIPGHRRSQVALGFGAVFVGLLIFGSHHARTQLEKSAFARTPSEALESVVLTPNPGNPFCLQFFTVSQDTKENLFIIRRGLFSHFGTPASCEVTKLKDLDTVLTKIQSQPEGNIQWEGEWKSSLSDLRRQAQGEDCHFAAFLRFARVPYRVDLGQGKSRIGDFRYERGKQTSFAEFHLTSDLPCPKDLPNWTPPRAKSLLLD